MGVGAEQALRVEGLRLLDQVLPLLERLEDVGCARDRAGNRQLRMPQYVGLILISLFNPTLQSLRGLQQASELERVQRKLGARRMSLGALSEAGHLFDPEPLGQIVAELLPQLPSQPFDARLGELRQKLVAVDGTLLKALPKLTQACYVQNGDLGWKLHTQFDVGRGLPERAVLTDALGAGETHEPNVLRRSLRRDCCYLLDRGYEQFALFNAIHDAGSSYVCRIHKGRTFTPDEPRELTAADRAAGVIEDAVGRAGAATTKRVEHPQHPVRRVIVRLPHSTTRTAHAKGDPAGETTLIILTNRLDVPAEIIALLYRYRWTIELFFRYFKHVLGCQHLLSEHPKGIQIQAYCALIACLLIGLVGGRKPTKRTYEMLCLYFQGWATAEELQRHLLKLAEQEQRRRADNHPQ
jgi:hypothetical protein